jgi:FAD/FMN-containing dehydrogenase
MEQVSDWTGRFTGNVVEVVRPGTPAEAAAVLRTGYAVTTRGGNTGLVGGAVPATDRDTVLLDTAKLRHIGPVDADTGQITVGAGVTPGELQAHLRGTGWTFGVDLAARGTATIGGMAATNAGGIRVIRYGMMRAQVVGVAAVLPNGEVIDDTAGLLKNNTGYSLSQLLVGSEGTLGVVTAARLRLHPPAPATTLAVLPAASLTAALAQVGTVRRAGAELMAAEVIDQASRRLVGGLPGVPEAPWTLFLEVADGGTADGLKALAEVADLVVATAPTEQRRLWEVREGMTDAWGVAATEAGTVVQKFDVSLPSPALDPFVAAVRGLVPAIGMFGHVGDGNLHLEVIEPDRDWDAPVLGLVAQHGGSISAEHGIGRAKRDYLQLSRSPAEIAAMRAIKDALDPAGVMNPGVLLPE